MNINFLSNTVSATKGGENEKETSCISVNIHSHACFLASVNTCLLCRGIVSALISL